MRGVAVDFAWNDTFVKRHGDAIATVAIGDRNELGAIRAVSASAPGSTLSLPDHLARNDFGRESSSATHTDSAVAVRESPIAANRAST